MVCMYRMSQKSHMMHVSFLSAEAVHGGTSCFFIHMWVASQSSIHDVCLCNFALIFQNFHLKSKE